MLFGPLHRSSSFIGELRCQAIQTEHGPYLEERTQKAVYIVICLWDRIGKLFSKKGNKFLKWGFSHILIEKKVIKFLTKFVLS
jgi:hypothetical protein